MAELQLERATSECESQQLVTQADPEHRDPSEQFASGIDPVLRRRRISGSVRQEDAVESVTQHLGGRGSGRENPCLTAMFGQQPKDVPLHPEVVRCHAEHAPAARPCRTDHLPGLVGVGHGRGRSKVHALHPGLMPNAVEQGHRIEVDGRHRGAHGAGMPDAKGQPARVDPLDPWDPGCGQILSERARRSPRGRTPGSLAHRQRGNSDPIRLDVLRIDPVVALVGRRHRHDLSDVGRVGENLLVSAHRGVEDRFAERLALCAEGPASERRAVLEHQERVPHLVG